MFFHGPHLPYYTVLLYCMIFIFKVVERDVNDSLSAKVSPHSIIIHVHTMRYLQQNLFKTIALQPPSNFRVSTTTSSTITFSWDALDNDVMITSYIITCSEGNNITVSTMYCI